MGDNIWMMMIEGLVPLSRTGNCVFYGAFSLFLLIIKYSRIASQHQGSSLH